MDPRSDEGVQLESSVERSDRTPDRDTSQERLGFLVENMSDIVCVVDEVGRILYESPSVGRILGYRPEERVGRQAYDLLHPADVDRVRQAFAKILSQPGVSSPAVRLRTRHRDGSWRTFEAIGKGLRDSSGRLTAIINFRDVTDRVSMQSQLERERVIADALINTLPGTFYVADESGRLVRWNRAVEEQTGLSSQELSAVEAVQLIHEDDRAAVAAATLEAFKRGYGQAEGRVMHRDGSSRLVLLTGGRASIRGVNYFVGTGIDITERAQAEERAARAERLEAVGRLAGGIAHDFNNILSVIVGYTQMIRLKCPEDFPIQEDLEAIQQATKRAADLVKQILTFSRQGRGEPQPVQVGSVTREAVRFLRASIPSTVEIRSRLGTDAVVMADPGELHRVVVNLATNAALAMREVGGMLDIALDDLFLDESFTAYDLGVAAGRYVRLRVRDTGQGMAPEVVSHIFEPFFTTRARGEGSGLGLAVVHGIVKQCRGAITVESELGKGTTVDVYLPMVSAEMAEAPPRRSQLARGTESLLYVDDEPLVTRVMAEVLGRLGYRIQACTNGSDALALFERDPAAFDLVITDMTMPGMTGDVLAQRMKSVRPDLPVILCTGFNEKTSPEQARAQGIDAFVMKPVLMSDLTQLIRKLLDED